METVNVQRYLTPLRETAVPCLIQRGQISNVTFMQDGATNDTANPVKAFLIQTFGEDRIVSRRCSLSPTINLPRSYIRKTYPWSKMPCYISDWSLANVYVALDLIHHIWHSRERLCESGQIIGRQNKTSKKAVPRIILVSLGRDRRFGDNFAKELQCIPLSNDTVAHRNEDIAEDVEQQLLGKLRDKLFSIHLGETTDIN
ncbi:hypothetical protein TNCV_4380081 [Trichonephila clavipes]|nr:hypothetical protein TNCV_4380081 [Trichonephila clavipes]